MTAQDVPVPAVNDHDSAVDVPPPLAGDLYQKIREGTAKVGVVGLGYVGLPTMVAAVAGGFKVTGIDVDKARADQINAGQSYIEDVDSATLASMVGEEKISATTDPTVLETLDVIVICVPTPVNKHKEPELGALQDAVHTVAAHMRPIHDAHGRSFDDPDPATLGSAADRGEQLVILQSTSYPGTTEELVLPLLKGPGREVGREFYLAFSPERIDPGNRQFFVNNIPKVVGGVTPQCSRMAAAFFSAFVEQVIPVSSPKVAEMTKLLENIFRSVNIALANEMAEVCRRMGIDIWEVIHAASTKPFGFMPFYPGIGVGGHCISVDPFYLSWKAKEYDFYVNFIELAARTNDNMPYYAVPRIADILANEGATIRGARLLLLEMWPGTPLLPKPSFS